MRRITLALVCLLAAASPARATIAIDTVPVGNVNNAGDPQTGGPFGAVGSDYRIGTYEVTNNQYAAFLNAVAATDTFALYNASMGGAANLRGGITQSGASGSFTYAAQTNMGEKPVNYVSWYDAARFTNWLHNNQPIGAQGAGTTETGAYTLLGGTTTPTNGLTVTREPTATWFLPSENEWYKAAYYNPTTASYFTFPTSSNTPPTIAAADIDGDVSNPGANVANYNEGADWNGQNGNVTTVGSADDPSTMAIESASPYLTFDQGGNVFEWNEALVTASSRGVRGGTWNISSPNMLASSRNSSSPSFESNGIGFRVATVPSTSSVPESSQVLFGAIVTIGFLCWKRLAG